MFQKLIWTKTKISQKLIYHPNKNVDKTEMLLKPKVWQNKSTKNWNFTKTKISLKLKCHLDWNVTKNLLVAKKEMGPK